MAMTFELDCSGVAALLLPEPDSNQRLPEADVAVENRGVKVSWALEFLRAAGDAFEDAWRRYEHHQKAYEHLNWSGQIPPAVPPDFERRPPLNGYLLQEAIVRPLTRASRSALYSRIPEGARGRPNVFVSHAWRDPLGCDPGSTLVDMVSGNNAVPDDAFCWIDLFVYNQHVDQDIARDMERIIGGIGKIVLPMSSEAVLQRLWCIWEWLAAHRAGAEIVMPEAAYSRYYFGRKRAWFRDAFTSISAAHTTHAADAEQIISEIVGTFGSVQAADEAIRRLADRYFTRPEDAPWWKA